MICAALVGDLALRGDRHGAKPKPGFQPFVEPPSGRGEGILHILTNLLRYNPVAIRQDSPNSQKPRLHRASTKISRSHRDPKLSRRRRPQS